MLASGSPRRRALLTKLGYEFEVRVSDVDETQLAKETPAELVARLALAKAHAVVGPGELALGADTVVALGLEVLGKPADAAEAGRMLQALSGRSHEVWTGVALVRRELDGEIVERSAVSRTEVVFRALGEEEIRQYVMSGEPLDKAGAYAIQGGAARFVERYEGDFDNVVGLPLGTVRALLESARLAPVPRLC